MQTKMYRMDEQESKQKASLPSTQTVMDATMPSQQQVPGMAYVPAQAWNQLYPLAKGFQNGTIFPVLNKPFDPNGRCQK